MPVPPHAWHWPLTGEWRGYLSIPLFGPGRPAGVHELRGGDHDGLDPGPAASGGRRRRRRRTRGRWHGPGPGGAWTPRRPGATHWQWGGPSRLPGAHRRGRNPKDAGALWPCKHIHFFEGPQRRTARPDVPGPLAGPVRSISAATSRSRSYRYYSSADSLHVRLCEMLILGNNSSGASSLHSPVYSNQINCAAAKLVPLSAHAGFYF